jgi:phosphoribosyl-AMP cyclohydrolase
MTKVKASMFDPNSVSYTTDGLVPVIAQEEGTGEVLMMAWMNREAIEKTLVTKKVTYWSRSRAQFWIKGETSGHVQELVDLRIDCDRDCLLAIVRQTGPACHTNRKSCFYTSITGEQEIELFKPI